MTTYTETQLATRVLKDLGLLASDEVPTAEELIDAIEACSSEIIATLSSKGKISTVLSITVHLKNNNQGICLLVKNMCYG